MNSSLEAPKIARPTMVASLILAAIILALVAGSALAANLVKNGSFEKDSNGDGIPNSWVGNGLTPADKRVCNQSYAGNCSFKMIGDGNIRELIQMVAVPGLVGDEFNLTAWTKGKAVDLGATGVARVHVQFNNSDNSITIQWFDMPGGSSPWTKHQVSALATKNFDSITVFAQLLADSGKMWMDKVKLVAAP
jgi:hypothetical protein